APSTRTPGARISNAATAEMPAGPPASATAVAPTPSPLHSSTATPAAGGDPPAARREVAESAADHVGPPPPFSSTAVRNHAATVTDAAGRALGEEIAICGSGGGSPAATAAQAPRGADDFGREKAAAAKAAATAASAAAVLASAKAEAAAEAAAQAAAQAGEALEAVAAGEDPRNAAGAPPLPKQQMRALGNQEVVHEASLSSADEVGVRPSARGEARTAEPVLDSMRTPAVSEPVEKAVPVRVAVEDAESPAAAAAAAAVKASATPATRANAAESMPPGDARGDSLASIRSAAAAAAAAAPPSAIAAVAFPPLLSGSPEDDWDLSGGAAAPAGATILSGSVGADVFSSRSGDGPCPWPGSSEEEDDDGYSDADDNGGLGGSSRHRMTVAEAAAFMNLGSAGNGSAGAGAGFASAGSSWATTGTSPVADLDLFFEAPAAGAASQNPGFVAAGAGAAAAAAAAAATAFATYGGSAGGDFGTADANGDRPLSLGASLSRPFFGPDDFLSPSAFGMGGLSSRRLSCDPALLSGFWTSSG
ncbi:unnamed protein product, partial [Hapterophycus canaliculatus]